MPAPPDNDAATPADPVHLDSLLVVDFTAGGTSAPYRTFGWSTPEAGLCWSIGPRSGLRLPAPWDDRPRVLEIDLNPCRHAPQVEAQALALRINGRYFGTEVLGGRTVLRCPLAPDVWRGRDAIEVTFEHPNFFIPRLVGPSADTRPLAISFFSARLYSEHAPRPNVRLPARPAPVLEPLWLAEQPTPATPPVAPPDARPALYAFGAGHPASGFTGEGWGVAQSDHQWTSGPCARLTLPALPGSGAYLLRLVCGAGPDATQDVTVLVHGRVLGHLTITRRTTVALPLPIEDALWAAPLDVSLLLAGGDRGGRLCLHEIGLDPLRPALAGWAGQRADSVAPPPVPVPLADRFCGVAEGELAGAVQTQLGAAPAALLPSFVMLAEDGTPPAATATERAPAAPRTYVLARARTPSLPELLPLLQGLNRDGPATLLFLTPGARPERNAAVELLGPGLMRGHVAALTAGAGTPVPGADWLRLVANAAALRAGTWAPAASAPPPRPAPPPAPKPPEPPKPPEAPKATEPPKPAEPVKPGPATPAPAVAEPAKPAPPPPAATKPTPPPAPSPPVLPPNAATILRGFESLGDNSEFGIVQRKAGVEVLGLLRFADITLPGLLDGLGDGFAGLADPGAISISLAEGGRAEYMLSVPRYGLRWPTGMYADEADSATTLQRQSMKLGYLRRKFLETLRAGGRVYVLRRNAPLEEKDAAAVATALAKHGRNTLLYVVPGASADEAGEVRQVAVGLLRGRLERLAPAGDPAAADLPGWLRLVANAWTLHEAK